MLLALHKTKEYEANTLTALLIWVVSSLILSLLFIFINLWLKKVLAKKNVMKVKKEEGIITFIKKNIFIMLATIFVISFFTAAYKILVFLL